MWQIESVVATVGSSSSNLHRLLSVVLLLVSGVSFNICMKIV